MKVLFLTTHNLATNPRLVKEIRIAIDAGLKIELICFEFNNWSKQINEALKHDLRNVTIISIPAGRTPFFRWFVSVAEEKTYRIFSRIISLPLPFLAQAVSRRNSLLIDAIKQATKPQLVIGHNPGALWATIAAGRKFNCKIGFDVEDYHPGEGHHVYHQKLSKTLMKKCLPLFSYVSFASPLIKKEVSETVVKEGKNWFSVMNFFPSNEFVEPAAIAGKVKLVWFSQNISHDRGLELVIPFIKTSTELELHLFGNMNNQFFEQHLKDVDNIKIHAPLPQLALHRQLANFDIGLALEPAKDRNNELAVSNKLLAYLQAGLFVLATNTDAQQYMMNTWPEHGYCFDYKKGDVDKVFNDIISQIERIRSNRKWRFHHFRQQNWENESRVLLDVWNN